MVPRIVYVISAWMPLAFAASACGVTSTDAQLNKRSVARESIADAVESYCADSSLPIGRPHAPLSSDNSADEIASLGEVCSALNALQQRPSSRVASVTHSLRGIKLSLISQNWSGIDFRGLDLRGSTCQGCSFHDTDFDEAWLSGANFSGSSFHRVQLGKSSGVKGLGQVNVEGSHFFESDLSGAELAGWRASDAVFYRTDLDGVNLHRADCRGCFFAALRSTDVILGEIQLPHEAGSVPMNPRYAIGHLVGLHAVAAVLTDSTWSQVRIYRSDFSAAQLNGIRVADTVLDEASRATSTDQWEKAPSDPLLPVSAQRR